MISECWCGIFLFHAGITSDQDHTCSCWHCSTCMFMIQLIPLSHTHRVSTAWATVTLFYDENDPVFKKVMDICSVSLDVFKSSSHSCLQARWNKWLYRNWWTLLSLNSIFCRRSQTTRALLCTTSCSNHLSISIMSNRAKGFFSHFTQHLKVKCQCISFLARWGWFLHLSLLP